MESDVSALEEPMVPFPFSSIPARLSGDGIAVALRDLLDRLLMKALTSQTVEEFRGARRHDFREFCTYARALSQFVTSSTNPRAGGRLSLEGMRANELEFRESAPAVIGMKAASEASFHFVTLRKVFEMVYAMIARECDTELDRVAAKKCGHASLWVTYHYECLLLSSRKGLPIAEEPLRELLSSLAIVDVAYIAATQGFQPRFPERQLHGFPAGPPSANLPSGEVETIAEDALRVYQAWGPSRDRANKETIPQ
jgi:hypothetical protein